MAKTPRKRTRRVRKEPEVTALLVPVERIERSILLIRGEKVMLDADLAELYGVTTKRFNEQIRRNLSRFPSDFMFQLTAEEYANLRSQSATSSSRWGGRRYPPYAFTEHGAIMAANILNSERAVAASIMVVRAFVQLRQILSSHAELARQIRAMEKQYDSQFKQVFAAIRALMMPADRDRIGF
ncbi:MAG TPA: ORF6N domain-containing protein [Thermoanaerobaculia bacterium]|nr:ORF6N domain-containing protein [Thermoanaerobaculia bacterium]